MSFREKLIKLRNDNKLSQQEFADLIGVSRPTVSRWEAGKSVPSTNQITKICKAFHIQANDLVDSGDEIHNSSKQETLSKNQSETAISVSNPKKKLNISLIVLIGIFILIAIAGLIITIVYAVKDARYDTSSTVWIVSIPQNTPFVVLSIFIALFVALLAALLIYLLRGKKR